MDISHLYIEPTSFCNLNCEMCSRNQWKNETIGHMKIDIFDKILSDMPDTVTKITFGGIGEPLFHPDILYMVSKAKSYKKEVEIITNGTLLSKEFSQSFVNSKIDKIWISLDSLEEDEYSAIRKGGGLFRVLQNIKEYNKERNSNNLQSVSNNSFLPMSKLGISFILMKKNLDSFKNLVQRAYFYGIDEIKVTHLIPYDEKTEEQVCYRRISNVDLYSKRKDTIPHIDLPLLEPHDLVETDLVSLFNSSLTTFSLLGVPLERRNRYCRFVNEGCIFVRQDGAISPCMALLHDNKTYQNKKLREITHCSFGNVENNSLEEIYYSKEYTDFRNRVTNFSFSHCTDCASCDLFLNNNEDCSGNVFPTCGGCLWSEGLFQCP